MAVFAFCYQLEIPDSVDRLGKYLVYTPVGFDSAEYISLESISLPGVYGPSSITYYFCAEGSEPVLQVFGQIESWADNGMTLTGGMSSCTSDLDCYPDQGNGGETSAYCYQISIDTTITQLSRVSFDYTPYGSTYSSTVLASNWNPQETSGPLVTLYVCSTGSPIISVNGDPVFDPSGYGIYVSGGTSSCTSDSNCAPSAQPTDCVLSGWGYGESSASWVEGTWSPCTLLNGSYQQYQTRYVITPASNGGTCIGETIRYQSCTPEQSGSSPVVGLPIASDITLTSATLTATITSDGGSPLTLIRFKVFQNGSLILNQLLDDFRLGYSINVTGLIPSTQYTFTTDVFNSIGNTVSQAASFSTLSTGGITTPTITGLSTSGATLTSTFNNTTVESYSNYGIIYKIGNSNNLTLNSPGVVRVQSGSVPAVETFELISQVVGLAPNTQYFAKAYVQGSTTIYSSAVNFTTSEVGGNENLAQLSISSVALPESYGSSADYAFITNPAATLTRSYLSVINRTELDPTPGIYRITTTLQNVISTSLVWTIEKKSGPSETGWTSFSIVNASTNLAELPLIPGWTYYTYGQDLQTLDFRPASPGYYRIVFKGVFNDSSPFTVYRELVIGKATTDLSLNYGELRQGNPNSIQLSAIPSQDEWIPEFISDGLYGISVSQSGTSVSGTFVIDTVTKTILSTWGISEDFLNISPTLTIDYVSPFKGTDLSNTFSKEISVSVLPPVPTIQFSNLSIFNNPVTVGSNITIGVSTLYTNSYSITSPLGNGTANNPVTYNNVQAGTYTITATATNGSNQTSTISRTLTVQPAAPILSQLPQQICGRNQYVDINTLSYVNLNGSSFSNLEIVSQPSNGTLTIINYVIRYIPNINYTGTDLFSVRVKSQSNTYSTPINISILSAAPQFIIGSANEPIVFNSTEVTGTRDIVVPIENSGQTPLIISSIELEQESTDFSLRITSNQEEINTDSINDITIQPGFDYSVKIRVSPTSIGIRTAKLKIDHN